MKAKIKKTNIIFSLTIEWQKGCRPTGWASGID